VLAAGNEPQRLYELGEQTRIQNEAWPDMKGSVLPGAYPPYVAYLLKPLATLGPVGGKVVWTLASLVVFFIATFFLSRLSSTFYGATSELSVALLLFPPVLMGVIGGQLIAMSMVLYVLIMVLDRQRNDKSEFLLGAVIGAWLFKPHYALLALLLFLMQGRLRVAIGFILPALVYYALGIEALGFDWVFKWTSFTRNFAEMNYVSNAAQMSNIVGATLALLKAFQGDAQMILIGRSVALGICSFVMLGLLLFAWRDRKTITHTKDLPSRFLLLLGPCLAFASPQANFYDLGLAAIPLLLLLRPTARDWLVHFVPCVVLGFMAVSFRGSDVPIFAILSLALFVTVLHRVTVVRKDKRHESLVL
jgi:hypothetical protein